MKKTILNFFTILLMTLASFGLSAQDSLGTSFWTGLLSNQSDNNNTLALYLVSEVNTTATVTIPGLAFNSVVNLTGGVLTTVALPSTAWASSYFTVLDRGINIVSNDPISVYSLNADAATTDASLVLPTDALGLDHYVMSYRTTIGGLPSNMLIVAAEDNTTVTITTTVTVGGFTAGVPANVTLNEGQVYSLSSTGADTASDDLTGTRVQSDKPIAVIGGNECTQVPNGKTYCDHIYEQIQPNSTWGTTFITTPLATRLNGDRFRILAQEASTEVSINGAPVVNLNAGEFYETVITGASEVNATKPILVTQYSHSTAYDGVLSDPFMLNVPPTDQFLASYIVGTVQMIYEPSSQVNYLNLTSPTSAIGSVTLDGNPVVGWAAVGASGFSHASVQVANGQHSVNSPLPVGLLVYGFSSVESYGYVGGQSFSPVATVSEMSLDVANTTSIQAQEKCVIATVLDQNSDPVVGVLVNFTVSGANTAAGFGNTDANGEVILCYNTCLAGTDELTATIAGLSDSVTIEVAPSTLTVTPTVLNASPGVESCVTATVLDGSNIPVPDAEITFTVTGTNAASGIMLSSNAAGEVEFCYTPASTGNDVITLTAGCFDGNNATVNVTINSSTPPPPASDLFITKWVVAAGETITIPTTGSGYDYNVDWSYDVVDGFNAESTNQTGDATSPVLTAGEHVVAITGDFPRIYFNDSGDKDKITEIVSWGTNPWTSMLKAFKGCSNLNITNPTVGVPDLSMVRSMSQMFERATSFNGAIGNWDVSNVTNMNSLFADCSSFNQDLQNWDVSSVIKMNRMFIRNYLFDQDISNWDTGNVNDMNRMFQQASVFNSAIGNWDVSTVENMQDMFFNATSFNQDISNWDTSSVTNMFRMFRSATLFDQNLGAWDIGNVIAMEEMLFDAELSITNYDATLIGWATDSSGIHGDGIDDIPSNITFSGGYSRYCNGEAARNLLTTVYSWIITDGGFECGMEQSYFITKWLVAAGETITIPTLFFGYDYDVDWSYDTADGFIAESSNVTGNATSPPLTAGEHIVAITGDFPRIFFNNMGDKDKIIEIVQWGTNPWTTMDRAFSGCTNLNIINPAVGKPNLTELTSLSRMFNLAESFNGDVGHWDVSNVTDMSFLFKRCISFNQDLDTWDTSNVTKMEEMFNQAHVFNSSVDFDVSNVETMAGMFFHTGDFNQDISGWDTSSVTDMYRMFNDARAFDQNLGTWDIGNVTSMEIMFFDAGLSTANYDSTLIGWAADSSGTPGDGIDDIPTNINFDGGSSTYCAGEPARDLLMSALPAGYEWTITDGGLDCTPAPLRSGNNSNLDLDLISLYPNPMQNRVNIISPNAVVISAIVYDIHGRNVSEVHFSNQTDYQIDLSDKVAAVYFIRVVTENGTVNKRVIKK